MFTESQGRKYCSSSKQPVQISAENSSPQFTENTDEILFRIIDTEIKRSGQLVYASLFSPTIHAEADKLKKLFPELRIAIVHNNPVVDRCRF